MLVVLVSAFGENNVHYMSRTIGTHIDVGTDYIQTDVGWIDSPVTLEEYVYVADTAGRFPRPIRNIKSNFPNSKIKQLTRNPKGPGWPLSSKKPWNVYPIL